MASRARAPTSKVSLGLGGKRGTALGLAAVLVLGGYACGFDSSEPDADRSSEPSVAYMLAVIDGNPSEEGEFQEVLDCIRASGIKGAETEEQIGDVLVASWEESGKQDSLLEWARAFC